MTVGITSPPTRPQPEITPTSIPALAGLIPASARICGSMPNWV